MNTFRKTPASSKNWMSEGRSGLGLLGAATSLCYIVGLGLVIPHLQSLGWVETTPLSVAELGDFLAGAFAPLAFFWLILGFFQQGRELRLNAEAIRLQTQELVNSVATQKTMADTARQELVMMREAYRHERHDRNLWAASDFTVIYAPSVFPGALASLTLKNIGQTASRLQVQARVDKRHDLRLSFYEKSFIEKDASLQLQIDDPDGWVEKSKGLFTLTILSKALPVLCGSRNSTSWGLRSSNSVTS